MTCYKIVEFRENAFGLGFCLAFEHLRHHGSRGFRDSAATALETNVADRTIVHIDVNREVITTQRIKSLRFVVGSLNRAEVFWLLAVLKNHFLIKIAQLANV